MAPETVPASAMLPGRQLADSARTVSRPLLSGGNPERKIRVRPCVLTHRALHNLAVSEQVSLNRVIVKVLEASLDSTGLLESPVSAGVSGSAWSVPPGHL